MLQELVRAYADAYTVPFTASRSRREDEAEPRESPVDAPAKTRRRIWRGLFSAFL